MKRWIVSLGEEKVLEFFDTKEEAVRFFETCVRTELKDFDDTRHHTFEEWWVAEINCIVAQVPLSDEFKVKDLSR